MKRQLLFACAVLSGLSLPTLAQEGAPNEGQPQGGPRLKIERNIEFARVDGQALQLDLYRQDPAAKPSAVVVWIHGDDPGFSTKSPTPAAALVTPGFAVASIDYRIGPGSNLM